MDLCIGKLDSIKNYDRNCLKEYKKNIKTTSLKNNYNFKKEIEKIKQLEQIDKIRVWSSHLNCDDYCLLLFVCNYFEDKNISVVFSEEYNWFATTCTSLDENQINDLLNREYMLKKCEISQYKEEWKQIVKENTELRFMVNGVVKSVNIDYFDSEILNRLEQLGEVNIYSLVASLIGNPIMPYVSYSDYIYLYLIKRLIDNNMIKKIEKNDKIFLTVNSKKINK